MTFIDMFAGIGGGRRGLEQAGFRCVGYCEVDEYCRKSYEAIHGVDEWRERDIREVKDVPYADIWIVGAPCQSFSTNGRREGLKGESGVVEDIFRLLKREDRPKWVIIENVKGIFTTRRGLDFLWVISTLDELGYDTEWQVFNTRDFGLAQNRERVYIIAHLRAERLCGVEGRGEVLPIYGDTVQTPCEGEGIKVIDGNKRGYDIAHVGDSVNFKYLASNNRRGRVGHKVAQCLITCSDQAYVESVSPVRIRKLTAKEYFRLQGWTDEDFKKASSVVSEKQLYKQAGNGMSIPVVYEIGKKIWEIENRKY